MGTKAVTRRKPTRRGGPKEPPRVVGEGVVDSGEGHLELRESISDLEGDSGEGALEEDHLEELGAVKMEAPIEGDEEGDLGELPPPLSLTTTI